MNKRQFRTRQIIVGSIGLALIVAGFITRNSILGLMGILGLSITLQFTQLDRWQDKDQTEMYLPTFKKWWEIKDDDENEGQDK